jgi:hypothetical protein
MKKHGLVFLSGVICAMLLVSILGRATLEQPQFSNLKRFWTYQSPAINFFPTARQVNMWALQQIQPNQKVIVIGGSSVLLGNGQQVSQTVSANLQEMLGREYVVLNLAVRGGASFGQGFYVAAFLKSLGYNVTYISEMNPGYVPPIQNNPPYEYFFWQSIYAGTIPKENQSLAESSLSKVTKDRIMAFINDKFYFMELANYISYNFINLNHSLTAGEVWVQPLKRYPDEEMVIPFEQRNLSKDLARAFQERVTAVSRIKLTREQYDDTATAYKEYFDMNNLSNSIMMFCKDEPTYIETLNSSDRDNYFMNIENQMDALSRLGVRTSFPCRSLADKDFADVAHLAPSGARKVALNLYELLKLGGNK